MDWIGVTGRSETSRSKVWEEVVTGFCREIPSNQQKAKERRYDNVVGPLRPEYAPLGNWRCFPAP